MHRLKVVVAVLALSAGAQVWPGEIAAGNPHHQCRGQGYAFGTEAFDECLETRIAARCAHAGHARGSPGFARCVEDLREAVFLTRQLEIRGYRLFNETN